MYVCILIIYYYLELSIKYIDYLQTLNLSFDEADCTREDYYILRVHFKTLDVSLVKELICMLPGAQATYRVTSLSIQTATLSTIHWVS